MKNNWIKYSLVAVIALVCISLDQVSKLIAINNLIEYKSVPVINNFFNFTLCYNTGGAWSIFSNATWLLVIISIIALGFIIYTIIKSKSNLYTISASVFMGGLIGNLIDRIFNSKVTDFLDFIIFGYDFPVFNFADIFIVVSAALIIFAILKEENKEEIKDGKDSN